MATPTTRRPRRVGRPPGPPPDHEARREELLDAAERVIRSQGPDFSMNAIAAEIGLTKPVVYRSLGDKAELSAALGRRVGERLAGELGAALGRSGSLDEVVAGSIDVFCRFVDEDTNLYRFVVHGAIGTRRKGTSERSLVSRLGGEIDHALRDALTRADADPAIADTWAYAILGAVFAATEHWLHHRHTTRAQLVTQLVDLITPALQHSGLSPA
jgi:AcrR family transcriptional regulator